MTTPGTLDERVTGTKFGIPQHPRVEPLTVRNVLHKRPEKHLFTREESSSLEALRLMSEHDVSAVLVLDGDRISGLFSEHDYLRCLVRDSSTISGTTVREIMTPCHYFARPSDLVQNCLTRMFENKLSYLPVTDESNPAALLPLDVLLKEMVGHLEAIHREILTDQQVMFLRGTYSC